MDKSICVVIPAYNVADTLARALDSVARQTRLPDEVIVVDDGSTDDTVRVFRNHPLAKRPGCQIVSQENNGLPATRNVGILTSRSDYIALLDADDEFAPDHLAQLGGALQHFPDAVVVWAGMERIYDNDSPACQAERGTLPDFGALALQHTTPTAHPGYRLVSASIFADLIRGNFIPPSAALFKRVSGGRANLFERTARFAEDRIFFLGMLAGGPGIFSEAVTCLVHRSGTNLSVTTVGSKAHANNEKTLAALELVRRLKVVQEKPEHMRILHACIEGVHAQAIYHASRAGVRATIAAALRATRAPEFRLARNAKLIAKGLARSTLSAIQR